MTIMLSFDNAINILKELPYELVQLTSGYLNGIDMVNFINMTDIPININSINTTNEELIIFNLLENDNKLYKWCKILHNAADKTYYKIMYKAEHRYDLKLPTGADNKYIFKLKMGLFLNTGINYYYSSQYSKLNFDKISIIYKTFLNYPGEFSIWTLEKTIDILKDNNDYNNNNHYIKTARRIKQIGSFRQYHEKKDLKIVCAFPDINYERFINIMERGATFSSAFYFSKNIQKYSNELIDKFFQLKEELEFEYIYEKYIISNLKNDKKINCIRIFSDKGINIILLINDKLPLLDYLIKNNYFYKFSSITYQQMSILYDNNIDVFKEIFTKFTIKQQNNLRMKELMEDGGYEELLTSYLINNINCIYKYIQQPINNSVSVEQFFNAYIELTDTQFKIFIENITNGSNYYTAIADANQNVDY